MRKTRGPAVYGSLHLETLSEENLAWSWAKFEIRKRFPRCKFWQSKAFVIATKSGEPVAAWIKNVPGEMVTL